MHTKSRVKDPPINTSKDSSDRKVWDYKHKGQGFNPFFAEFILL